MEEEMLRTYCLIGSFSLPIVWLKNPLPECQGDGVVDNISETGTVKDYLIVRQEGKRQVQRSVNQYNLEARFPVIKPYKGGDDNPEEVMEAGRIFNCTLAKYLQNHFMKMIKQ